MEHYISVIRQITSPDCRIDISVLVTEPSMDDNDSRHVSVEVGVMNGVRIVDR